MCFLSGDGGIRTPDPRLAKPVLSQLSYIPTKLKHILSSTPHCVKGTGRWLLKFSGQLYISRSLVLLKLPLKGTEIIRFILRVLPRASEISGYVNLL